MISLVISWTDEYSCRFNRLAWGHADSTRSQGVIAAGLENGELALWDPAKILAGAGYAYVVRL